MSTGFFRWLYLQLESGYSHKFERKICKTSSLIGNFFARQIIWNFYHKSIIFQLDLRLFWQPINQIFCFLFYLQLLNKKIMPLLHNVDYPNNRFEFQATVILWQWIRGKPRILRRYVTLPKWLSADIWFVYSGVYLNGKGKICNVIHSDREKERQRVPNLHPVWDYICTCRHQHELHIAYTIRVFSLTFTMRPLSRDGRSNDKSEGSLSSSVARADKARD